MSGLVFNGFEYLKPLYSIVARSHDQLPKAFEQLEKLRKSGYLVGYVRKEAFAPAAPACPCQEQGGETGAGTGTAPLLKFGLYRLRKEMVLPAAEEHFCPALAGDPAADALKLASACQTKSIHALLAQSSDWAFAHNAHFFDAFEDMIFLGESGCLLDEEAMQALDARPVQDILAENLAGSEVLMCLFGKQEVCLAPSTLVLDKTADGSMRLLCASDRREDFVARLCRPKDAVRISVRLEGDRALLLQETLRQLLRLAKEHALPRTDDIALLEGLADALSLVQQPLPGSEAIFGKAVPCPWGLVPQELLARIPSDQRLAEGQTGKLVLSLSPAGVLSVQTQTLATLASPRPVAVARAVLDERQDDLDLDVTRPLLPAPMVPDAEDVACAAVLVVNRFAVLAAAQDADVLTGSGTKFFCVDAPNRPRTNVVLDFLLARGLVQERMQGLAQVLAAKPLVLVSPVYGLQEALWQPQQAQ